MFIPFQASELDDKIEHIQIPTILFNQDLYPTKKLCNNSKVLYGLLLSRVRLSKLHNWSDENGDVYIIFSRESVADKLGVTRKTTTKLFKELVDNDLLREEGRGGYKKANLIYLGKPPITKLEGKKVTQEGSLDVKITHKDDLEGKDYPQIYIESNKIDRDTNISISAFNTPKQNNVVDMPSTPTKTVKLTDGEKAVAKIKTALATHNFKDVKPQNIAYYYESLYMARYGVSSVPYFNIYNGGNVVSSIITKFNLSTEQICRALPSWFERYHSLGYANGDYTAFTFSLKTLWVIERIINNIPSNTTSKKTTNLDDKTIPKDVKERNARIRESYKDVVCNEVF